MSNEAFTVIPNTTRIIMPSAFEIALLENRAAQDKARGKERSRRFRESLANDPEKRTKRVEAEKRRKKENPQADAAYERRAKSDKYHKPFVSIDAEGQNYLGLDDIKRLHGVLDQQGNPVSPLEIVFPAHHTFLWGAKGSLRKHAASAIEKAEPEQQKRMLLEMEDTAEYWLGDQSKKPLTSLEIVEWLTGLPEKFGPKNGYKHGVVFVSFAFGYDATQILKGLPHEVAYKISRREIYGTKKSVAGFEFWKDYAFEYLKGKYLKIWKLVPGRSPWLLKLDKDGQPYTNANGELARKLNSTAHICIFDAFGFYQESFVRATQSLVDKGYVEKSDHDIVAENKKHRSKFDNVDFDTIKKYCGLELTMLSKALTVLRDGTDKIGIRLSRWSGAGTAAGELIKEKKLKEEHYSEDIAIRDISMQQDRAHHAFFGGRIELIKQGYAKDQRLQIYDIASAYPSACLCLPSMKGGTWIHSGCKPVRYVEGKQANILSMFHVHWNFPRQGKDGRPIPFFPFPYRTVKRGLILFPSAGNAWLMRDEVLAGIDWFKTFFPKTKIESHMRIEECSLFEPASDAKPYDFLPDMYKWRKALKQQHDITEKVIKLVINSLYGKTAQSIGGNAENGTPPSSACPYYASAITAWCRARVLKAALKDPYAIVSFMTDGICSQRPLDLGALLKPEGSRDVHLGDWEWKEVQNGFFLQSGVYAYEKLNKTGKAVRTGKSRGFDPKKIDGQTADGGPSDDPHASLFEKDLLDFFREDVLPIWRMPPVSRKSDGSEIAPTFIYWIKRYISIGEACTSPERFKLAGRWAYVPREMRVMKPGPKRDWLDGTGWSIMSDPNPKPLLALKWLEQFETWFGIGAREMYECIKAGEPLRCRYLVPTIPALNPTPEQLSAPAYPDWLDKDRDTKKVPRTDDREELSLIDEYDEDTITVLAGMS